MDTLSNRISEIATGHYVSQDVVKNLVVKEWAKVLDEFLEDGILGEDQENRLTKVADEFHLEPENLNLESNAHTRAQQAHVLRNIMNGIFPKIKIEGQMPVNLQKNEKIAWVFTAASYLEDKIRRSYVGSSKGISVRLAKGLYYRTGAFKGQPIERQERIHIDTGAVIITDKHLYFAGPNKSLRVPYKKIVSFLPFNDGIGFIRDAQTAKPQIFVTGYGWFAYNLVTNLAKLAE